jgi:hypothetical protein
MTINLPDVTLLALSSIEIPATIGALIRCCDKINFGAVKFVSDLKPDFLPDDIQYEYAPKITCTRDFDDYAFLHLGKHIQTSHMLIVQYHAWIVRPELWEDSWLEYGFIGAPWPERPEFISQSTGEMVRVGNGGFSLRSKKLLDLPVQLGLPLYEDRGYTNDDGLINSYYRKTFKENGIKYPSVEVAARFSFENLVPENNGVPAFGFHRYLNPTIAWNYK